MDDDFNQLTQFIFDQSTPESDEEIRVGASPEAHGPFDLSPPIRIGRTPACIACHKRKVRCDTLGRGHTCTNCLMGGITCAVRSGSKRIRGKPQGIIKELPARSSTEMQPSQPIHPINASATIHPPAVESSEDGPAVTFSGPRDLEPFTRPFPILGKPAQPSLQTDMLFSYFDFLTAETWSHIAPEDFRFLEYKGCFHLPSGPILDDLVREYFLHVHPVLPIIDEREFWGIYLPSRRRAGYRKISLFVFRAMLFVSCSFASDDTIRQMGFQSAVEARTCLYGRAKLLYNFDTTSDPISLSQGALILTYYSSDREPLANTSWLRLAIQYANSASVPMYDQDQSISPEDRLIRKRLWWCLILRDRVLSLGMRRPIQITRDTFDFSQPTLSATDLEPEFGSSRVYDTETKGDLARIFQAQLDLAVELTDPISYIYPVNSFRSFDKLDSRAMLLIRSEFERCKESLDSWNSNFRKSISLNSWSNKHKSVALYSGLTTIYYQSARAALCQYESFYLQSNDSREHGLRMKELGRVLQLSIANISDTIAEFVQLSIAKYLPVSAVAYLALPIVLNSIDLQTPAPTNVGTEAKRRQLELLNEAMDLCHKRYTGTTSVNSMIKRTIEAARSEHDVAVNKPMSLLHSNDFKYWLDVFESNPTQYLRISSTIDISLCMGLYPDTEDCLHQLVSLQNRLVPFETTPQTLIPVVDGLKNTDDPNGAAMSEPTRNIHLGIFDFSEVQNFLMPEGTPWNGQMVDEMLDAIFGEGGTF